MLKKLVNLWKKNKRWFLLSFPLTIVFIIISTYKKPNKNNIPLMNKRKTSIEEYQAPRTLKIMQTSPPNGSREETPSPFIKLVFNKEINVQTLKYSVYPEIQISLESYEQNPNEILIMPIKGPWEEKTEYVINIEYMESTSGDLLEKPIKYFFYFDPPDIIPGGESWM